MLPVRLCKLDNMAATEQGKLGFTQHIYIHSYIHKNIHEYVYMHIHVHTCTYVYTQCDANLIYFERGKFRICHIQCIQA